MAQNPIWSRRSFLKFIGASAALSQTNCSTPPKNTNKIKGLPLNTKSDKLTLSPGLKADLLIKEGDKIGNGLFFGTNNDYTNFYDFQNGQYGLWVNHESFSPLLLHGRTSAPSLSELTFERSQLGGTFTEIQKENGQWKTIPDSELNFKVSGNTSIPLSHPIRGAQRALGTLANCSGGFTPWGTILTCEENYSHFYGERHYDKSKKGTLRPHNKYDFGWLKQDPRPTEHYGWVVEIDPRNKTAEKLVPLGRFAHECATVTLTKEGFPVVYSGDDAENEHLYKFVGKKKNSLKEGTLYVANVKTGKWISLNINDQPALKKKFKTQTEVFIRTREAAKLVGATPLDRPEDIEIDPLTKDVLVSLTNNKKKKNFHGSILKISEKNKSDLTFESFTFKAGGTESGFSCPDNMAFDQNGNLWITSDISGGSIGKAPYSAFGNNGLFLVPRSGPQAGQVIKVASAPNDAELTGPFFDNNQKTLFLSVQHPGEKTKSLENFTSNWPHGKPGQKPLSGVVTITGPLLESLTQK